MKKRRSVILSLLFSVLLQLLSTAVFASGTDTLPDTDSIPALSYAAGDSAPDVSAASAILMTEDGDVLWERAADTRRKPASTTKIMTALTVLRSETELDTCVKIPAAAVGVEGSSVYLYEGEELTLRHLLYAMLMESANDAAAAIAVSVGGSVADFADRMNETAVSLGLENTHFENPHGLDNENHYTTARELALMTQAAMKYDEFREMVSTYKMEIPLKGNEGIRLLVNHNRLLKSLDGCIGVKTGYTKASGRCLVSACTRDGVTLICVTLNAPDDWNDHTALYDWGFAQVERVTLSEVGEQYAVLPVVGAVTDAADGDAMAAVRNEEGLSVVLSRTGQDISKRVLLPRFLYAPVTAGDIVGYVVYYNGKTEIGRLALYASESVELYKKTTIWETIKAILHLKI